MQTEKYNINLESFEGPLDLLLHLIKKSDLEIEDIKVSTVLDQYIEYINLMKELDIDLAGDFIQMASELAHIKSKMLLFGESEVEDEGLDPRSDLMARLMEYQKYKMAASRLMDRPRLNRDIFIRPKIIESHEEETEEEMLEIEPFVLINTFNEILKRAPKETVHQVETERISITDRIYQIVNLFKENESLLLTEMFEEGATRSALVLTFLAILEMGKLKMIQIYQTDRLGPIRVMKRADFTSVGSDDVRIDENNN